MSTALNRAAEQASVFEATLFTPTGGVLAVAGTGGSRATPEPPPPEALRLARMQQPYKKIEQTGEGGLVLRVVVPVNTDDPANPLKLLQVIEPVPRTLAQEAERVQAGVRDYRELTLLRHGLEAALSADADADAAARADHRRWVSRSCCPSASRRRSGCWPRARAPSRRATSRGASRSCRATNWAC